MSELEAILMRKYGFIDVLKVSSAVGIVFLVTWTFMATLEMGLLRYVLRVLAGEV